MSIQHTNELVRNLSRIYFYKMQQPKFPSLKNKSNPAIRWQHTSINWLIILLWTIDAVVFNNLQLLLSSNSQVTIFLRWFSWFFTHILGFANTLSLFDTTTDCYSITTTILVFFIAWIEPNSLYSYHTGLSGGGAIFRVAKLACRRRKRACRGGWAT